MPVQTNTMAIGPLVREIYDEPKVQGQRSSADSERLSAARADAHAFFSSLGQRLFVAFVVVAISVGFLLASSGRLSPEEGTGYWLGITGGSAMLALLLYPLRKRVWFLRRAGAAPLWFRSHMILGVMGPLLILYHCNFSFGATNSNVALIAMLMVAGSGIVGRYVYAKIHNGLYGAKSTAQDLLERATRLLHEVEVDVGGAGGAVALKLTQFGERALARRVRLSERMATALFLPLAGKVTRWNIMWLANDVISQSAARAGWDRREIRRHRRAARLHIREYMDAVEKAAELSFYEGVFSLWHILHVPLFFLLIVTGVLHVIAVHMY